ncbi:MAG TPA: divergent polysaccharide deacetylase family protein [Smithellaceae bacterium]|nr:divergent polysaccharide deacetylase family protein [Smithellaceae bacterium]HPL66730.1 divergent polysaccharide deacetylase family protein [Smithellaceae bacterium]
MAAKKKKNNKKILNAFLAVLIVASVAAILYVSFFHREEKGLQPAEKKQSSQQKVVSKEKSQTPTRVKEVKEKEKTRDSSVSESAVEPNMKKEKIIVAKIVPPRLTVKQVAIIIDDIGQDMKSLRDLLNIDADITFAILPLLPHSREAAETLHRANRETLLHLPMEPLSYPKEKPGAGALFTEMNDAEIVSQLEKNMASVPYVSGVNNHMGSKFMADEEKLTPVFRQLKKEGLFFIDSRTTPSSKTRSAAEKVHLTVASRRVFLDNDRDYKKIYQILMNVIETPAGGAPLIVIGHPYPETIRAIRDASKVFREKGVSIIPVSKLIKTTSSKDVS